MSQVYELGLGALLIISSITDLGFGKLYNVINLPFLLIGLFFHLWMNGKSGAEGAALAVGCAFILFFPLYLLKIFAAGDVKLLMAIGAWSNPRYLLELCSYSILLGAMVGLFILVQTLGLKPALMNLKHHLSGHANRKHQIPFAPAFLCGFLITEVAQRWQWHPF